VCRASTEHSDKKLHHQFNVFLARLDEQQRRWAVALESKKMGHGGDRFMSQVTGLHVETIRRGREELENELEGRPMDRTRLPGAGRPTLKKTIPRSKKS
jgi:hypothetical protein